MGKHLDGEFFSLKPDFPVTLIAYEIVIKKSRRILYSDFASIREIEGGKNILPVWDASVRGMQGVSKCQECGSGVWRAMNPHPLASTFVSSPAEDAASYHFSRRQPQTLD